MVFKAISSPHERQPLLQSTPSHQTADHEEPDIDLEHSPPVNKISAADTCWILAAIWSGVFLGALDGTIVATLLTPIGASFNKVNQSSYIGTSYLLSLCCFTPLYGRLSDILGRKGALLLALSLFSSGTVLCGLTPSMEMLIAARAIAGMGGGGMMTVASITMTDLIPLKQRGLYQGMTNILFGLGSGLGGPLGGWISDSLGWRAAFLLQIPVMIFSFTLVAIKVNIKLPFEIENQSLPDKLRRIDLFGSLTLVSTIGCLLLGFSLKSTEEMAWSNPMIWGLFVGSGISGILFILVESHWAAYPVMPLRLIRQRTPLAVSLGNLVCSMSAFSVLYNIPVYFTAVRLSSASNAGLHLLPHSVAISIGSVFAGWMMRRTGKLYTLTLASSLSALTATILIIFWNENSSPIHLWADVIPQGFGMASFITTTLIAMIASVDREDMAVATGITYLFRTTGQVLGVSLSGAILQAVLMVKLQERIQGPGSLEIIDKIRHSTDVIHTLSPRLKQAAVDSYADALRVIFIFQAVCNFIGLLTCLPIQEHVLPGTHKEQQKHDRDRNSRNQDTEETQGQSVD